ncbi:hypothetical protein EV356DRAFT_534357 [Viridothelium virens]|uniref:Regulator of volume decrease after cellular swelling-domain-containing protein n=1 Tax=Viridothelium virens TaxID=1048519 RepID=A0A6A6H4C8_VIRVR|nr:hypothetical protein EV356DRAFT_534357 [Viridothelium virens]
MAVNIVHSAPAIENFTPLAEHQEQTPETFFGGKPVLHFHSTDAQLLIEKEALEANEAFSRLYSAQHEPTRAGASVNGDAAANATHTQITVPDIDIWVTSENFILYSPTTRHGLTLSYPTISLHALQHLTPPSAISGSPAVPALYIQLFLTSPSISDDIDTLEFSLVPAPSTPSAPSQSSEELPEDGAAHPITSSAEQLYAAVSACAELHPDPRTPGEQEEGEQEDGDESRIPGAGGWITSENMADFMDEEGNFIGFGGGLGPGAGTIRGRDDADAGEAEGAADVDGGEEGEETKWRRSD